jgi:hypothetical protein
MMIEEPISSLLESVHIGSNPIIAPTTTESTFVTKQDSFMLGNVQTDIVVNLFSDRVFVIISQMNKVGNLVRVVFYSLFQKTV